MILKRMVLVFQQKDIAYVSVDHKNETMVHIQYKTLHRIYKFKAVDHALMMYLFCDTKTEKIIKMKKGRYVIMNDHQIISMNLN